MRITTKENAKSIQRLKIALYVTIGVLAILSICTAVAVESLWTAII
jgi:hypothetical protein